MALFYRAPKWEDIYQALKASVGSLIVIALSTTFPFANERDADSAECKTITARIIAETGASFERYSPSGTNVFFKRPEMLLSCTTHRLTGVSISWEQNAFPDNSWFGLAARAGHAVTGVSPKRLETEIRRCHSAALKDKTELADVEIPNAKIECQAFTRDGGSAFTSIWINDHEARRGVEEPE